MVTNSPWISKLDVSIQYISYNNNQRASDEVEYAVTRNEMNNDVSNCEQMIVQLCVFDINMR